MIAWLTDRLRPDGVVLVGIVQFGVLIGVSGIGGTPMVLAVMCWAGAIGGMLICLRVMDGFGGPR